MGLDTTFTKAETALKSATIDVELMKEKHVQQSRNSKENKGKCTKGRETDGTQSAVAMTKANYDSATKALEAQNLLSPQQE